MAKPKSKSKSKSHASAAQRKIAAKYKKNPPSGQYIGPEGNKGRLPKGYKGPEKGKYYGPDSKKGVNPSYKAPKATTPSPVNKPAAAPANKSAPSTAPAPSTTPPKPENTYQAPNPSNTVSNGSGTIDLQTTHELNMQELDAIDERDQELAQAKIDEQQSIIDENTSMNAYNEQRRQDRGRVNSTLAYRGLTSGSTASQKISAMGKEHSKEFTAIADRRTTAKNSALARKTAAEQRLAARRKAITLARQGYTNSESGSNPTAGSKPEDSGIKPVVV